MKPATAAGWRWRPETGGRRRWFAPRAPGGRPPAGQRNRRRCGAAGSAADSADVAGRPPASAARLRCRPAAPGRRSRAAAARAYRSPPPPQPHRRFRSAAPGSGAAAPASPPCRCGIDSSESTRPPASSGRSWASGRRRSMTSSTRRSAASAKAPAAGRPRFRPAGGIGCGRGGRPAGAVVRRRMSRAARAAGRLVVDDRNNSRIERRERWTRTSPRVGRRGPAAGEVRADGAMMAQRGRAGMHPCCAG